jgi:predicted transglutaminase-like cysteine proteinase
MRAILTPGYNHACAAKRESVLQEKRIGKRRRLIGFMVTLLSCIACEAIAAAANDRADFMAPGRRVVAPFAHVVFCTRYPAECKPSDGAPMIKLDQHVIQKLGAVNTAVNRSIRGVNEPVDQWDIDVTSGDCEDYALTKRSHLIAMGMSPRALRIAVALTYEGIGHAVLVIRTDRGDIVLDNRTDQIKYWSKVNLHWRMIHSGENPRIWYRLPD